MLSLVSYPFTNNELSKKGPREYTKKMLSDANIYMLVQAKYPKIDFDNNNLGMSLNLTISDGVLKSTGCLDIGYALNCNYPSLCEDIANGDYGDVCLNFRVWSDPNCYLVVGLKDKNTQKIIKDDLIEVNAWQILYFKSRGAPFIEGFDDFRDFFNFKVHYVGKTTKNLYDRLVKGHHARGDILSSERTINSDAMLGEELLVLPFKVQSSVVGDNCCVNMSEKLLISSLQPDYNQIKYNNLVKELKKQSDFGSYQLYLNEAIALSTASSKFANRSYSTNSNSCSFIMLDEQGIKIH